HPRARRRESGGRRTRLRLLRGEPARLRGADGEFPSRRAAEAAPRRPPAAAPAAAPVQAGGRRGPAGLESLPAVLLPAGPTGLGGRPATTRARGRLPPGAAGNDRRRWDRRARATAGCDRRDAPPRRERR